MKQKIGHGRLAGNRKKVKEEYKMPNKIKKRIIDFKEFEHEDF